MYFDTLKVSTLEQTAEQTSARGGHGNPELIIWDYGKEISVSLENALYTPASQSLMWGGKFGTKHSKIKGVWNPMVFNKDKWGRKIYMTPIIASLYIPTEEYPDASAVVVIKDQDGNEYDYPGSHTWGALTENDGWVEFICPCDNQWKKVKYIAAGSHYKYLNPAIADNKADQITGYPLQCPTGKPIYEKDDPESSLTVDMRQMGYYSSELNINWKDIGGNSYRGPERAEIMIENYGKFDFKSYKYQVETAPVGFPEEGEEICVSTEIENDSFSGVKECSCGSAHSYIWTGTDLKMTSLEEDMDIYYSKDANVKYRVPTDSENKQVMIARRKLFETSLGLGTDEEWGLASQTEVEDFIDLNERQKISGLSYGWVVDTFESKVDFFINVKWTVPTVQDGEELNHMTRVKVGTFYIMADWNESTYPMEDLIYPINNGLDNVYVLERIEECKASQTFAINTDRNIRHANYRYMQEYAQSNLTVYIDPKTMKPFEPNANSFTKQNGQVVGGNLRIIKQHQVYYKWTRTIAPKHTSLGHRIIVDAQHFPGTYRLVGETYSRSRQTGKDQRYQFEIPLCKMSAENNLTLEAAGDPTTFTMNLKVLRKDDGTMMKLTQYDVDCNTYNGHKSGSTKVIPGDNLLEDYIQFEGV